MNLVKKIGCFGLYFVILTQNLFSVTPFQSMSKDITQTLLHAVQYTPFSQKDSHFQQLLHSTLSQLQNTNRISDINATIDIIISNLAQRKNDCDEVGISFTIISLSHILRIAAQRLYNITAYIRNNLHYWQKIDRDSVVEYCLTHFPTLWGTKIGNHLAVKELILTSQKLYTVFITHLGTMFRLIHTIPTKIDTHLSKDWIESSFAAISDLCEGTNITCKQLHNTEQNSAIQSLKAIKHMLAIFENSSKNNVLAIKKSIGQPPFIKRNFGKIVATISTIVGIGMLSYYKANSIKTWYQHVFTFAQENIWNPVVHFATNIFTKETTDGLLPKETVERMLNKFEETTKELDQKIAVDELSPQEKYQIETSLVTLIRGSDESISIHQATKTAKGIVDNTDIKGALTIIRDRAIKEKTAYGTFSDYITHFDIVISLFVAQLLPTAYRLGQNIDEILSEVLKAIARLDTEVSITRKIALLTPAVLSWVALYKSSATFYNYITKKDYHLLQKSLKELETATICSIDQPDNNQNYGLFIFILESLKQGVVQTVSSRYTDKQELLGDLARLESPELTFEQRYKLIAQIKQEYSIFQKQ